MMGLSSTGLCQILSCRRVEILILGLVIVKSMVKGGAAASFYGIGAERDSSSWRLPAELNEIMHEEELCPCLGSSINSAGSQFFICVTDLPNLDGNYTVFGKVLDGMDVVDNIMKVSVDFRDNPIERVEMEISICN